MMEDDIQSPLKPVVLTLENLSIAELESRIMRLKQEIADCEAVLEAKRAHRTVADQLFGGRT